MIFMRDEVGMIPFEVVQARSTQVSRVKFYNTSS